ncbi:hypothetical protein CIPAW_02G115100 [Carya illinoinensis]|uniref:Uncharacterized protein n=1 Tax=Carya illinoinensis TaxID=32201 RepID=A0A8T1RB83_CARIL|nr:hypothetical protein CIPAW_02G115100 [Carya illinoinensis]
MSNREYASGYEKLKKREDLSQLANEGIDDWKNLSAKFKIHETINEHITNMTAWLDLEIRLLRNKTIDKKVQEQINKEKCHWKKVLLRIITVVKTLSKNNLLFRGQNEKIYQENNENFLSLIEMNSEFDPIMQEHIRCIQDEAKYFSIILDCTPYASHQEQIELLDAIKNLELGINNPLSQRRWKSRIESIKVIKSQISQIREALLQLTKTTEDPKIKSEVNCLVAYEIENFEFILDMTIWYDILFAINTVNVAIDQLKCLISFFQDYRENGFKSAMISSKKIAISMEIKLKKQFDENVLKEILPIEESTPIDILNYIKRLYSFPNVCIAHRILLTKRLNELVILSIENEILEEFKYKNLISNFIFQKMADFNFSPYASKSIEPALSATLP